MDRPAHPFARLWREYLRSSWPLIALAALLMALEGASVGALAYMLQPMFDAVMSAGRDDLIPLVGLAIFGLFAVRGVAGVIQRILLTHISMKASARLQGDLLAHVLRLDSAYYAQTSPGTLIERVQGDVQAVQSTWTTIITSAGRDGFGLISLMVVALMVDPVWTLVAVIGAPLLVAPSLIVQRYIRKKGHVLRDIAGARTTRLDEIFHGIAPIKLNAMEGYQEGRFRVATDAMVRATVKAEAGSSAVPALVDFAVGLGFFAVLIYGGPQIISGEKSIGQFMSFFAAMSLAFQPLRRLAGLSGRWQMLLASLERIYALRDTPATITSPATPRPVAADRTELVFEDVTLRYGDAEVLRGISFQAQAGQTTALVGLSGAGKTSVFNVATRMVDPNSGRVTLGGVDIREHGLTDLRALFSVVSQETMLFDETLRENITLGQAVSGADLQVALEAAHVSEFLGGLPQGLDSPAGPRGGNLSGGQRQRVAIARAILRNAPILLLDEATSALDTRSERLVQDALARLSQTRTTLVIAHRLSTVREADQILVMDRGRIVERGTHDSLTAAGGLYTQLSAMQLGAEPEQPAGE